MGVFEEANGGTLFLDEIGDLDVALQAKLLRAIERSEVRRVGGSRFTKVDVRILSATRRDLDREVQAGRFRDDLFFRLAVSRVELPALRKREGDVSLLARAFWRALGGNNDALSGDFLRRLEDYDWPGNVRQLRNVVTQHFALGEMPPLEAPSLRRGGDARGGGEASGEGVGEAGDVLDAIVARDLPFFAARDAAMLAFEQRYVARVLAQHGGHIGNAAEASGMGRRYFQRIRNRTKGEEP
jgi:DNA-binding NtrC family response regulator